MRKFAEKFCSNLLIYLFLQTFRFKQEEIHKIREELETEMKFELIKREKELLANYEEKVNHFRSNFEREKEIWTNIQAQREREVLERREELIETIQQLHMERANMNNPTTDLSSFDDGQKKVSFLR